MIRWKLWTRAPPVLLMVTFFCWWFAHRDVKSGEILHLRNFSEFFATSFSLVGVRQFRVMHWPGTWQVLGRMNCSGLGLFLLAFIRLHTLGLQSSTLTKKHSSLMIKAKLKRQELIIQINHQYHLNIAQYHAWNSVLVVSNLIADICLTFTLKACI